MFIPAPYGRAFTFRFGIIKRGVVDLAATADWTPATGDTKLSKDGGNVANTTNNPAAVGGSGSASWTLTLTATEMQALELNVQIIDSASKAVEDQFLTLRTMPADVYDALYGAVAGSGSLQFVPAPRVSERLTQAFDSDATSHTVTMPATVHVGDLLVVIFGNDGSDTVSVADTAWIAQSSDANSTVARLSVYTKIALGTEGGTTVDFVTSGAQQASAIVLRIAAGTYYPNLSTLGRAVGSAATGTSVSPDPPSVTIPWSAIASLAIACYAADDQAQATAYPTGYQFGTTKQGANAAGASVGTAENIVAVTSENPGVFTIASQEWIAQTLIIRSRFNADGFQRGVPKSLDFYMIDSSDHVSPKTGLTVTATRKLDTGSFASCAGTVTEIANGWYRINLLSTDLDADIVSFKFTATGADAAGLTLKLSI